LLICELIDGFSCTHLVDMLEYMNMCWFLLNWMKYDVVVVDCWWFHDLMLLLLLWDVVVVEW